MNALLHLVPISAVAAARRIDAARHASTLAPTLWVPVRMGASWRLRRSRRRGEGWASEFFYGGNPQPLALCECDARALAGALNRSHRRLPEVATEEPKAASMAR
jgi:hypothetical protein